MRSTVGCSGDSAPPQSATTAPAQWRAVLRSPRAAARSARSAIMRTRQPARGM